MPRTFFVPASKDRQSAVTLRARRCFTFFFRRQGMRRFMMTLGSTALVLGLSFVAVGQDKGPPAQAPAQAPKQAPAQAPAPVQAPAKQAPMQAPAKQAPMQAPTQKLAPVQAP